MIRMYNDTTTIEEISNLAKELKRRSLKCSPHIAAACAMASKMIAAGKIKEAVKSLRDIKKETPKQASAIGVLASGLIKRLSKYSEELKLVHNVSSPYALTHEVLENKFMKYLNDQLKSIEAIQKDILSSEWLKPTCPQWIEGNDVSRLENYMTQKSKELRKFYPGVMNYTHEDVRDNDGAREILQKIFDLRKELEPVVWVYAVSPGKKVNSYDLAESFGVHRTPVAETENTGNDKIINKLLNAGGKRWTKGGYDRIYLTPDAVLKAADLEFDDDTNILHEKEISDWRDSKLDRYREKDFNRLISRDLFYNVVTGKLSKSGNLMDIISKRIGL